LSFNEPKGKKKMMEEEQQKNIKAWHSDPLNQELYALATNPNRSAADDARFNVLRDQQRQRVYEHLDTSTTPELNEVEKQATTLLRFAYGVLEPRKLKEVTK
jgi:hypothetical protein